MPSEPLPQAADADHLTNVLRRAGVLGDGRIRDVGVESSHAQLVSRVIRLRLEYDGAADAPSSLILKIGLPNRRDDVWETGRREGEFYTRLASMTSARLVPRCFDAAFGPNTKAWHLLLEDLTATHVIATQWPLPPTMEECKRMLGALARFHAGWWDDPRLGVSVGASLDDGALNQLLLKFAKFYESFADRLGDRLSPDRRDIYERFIASAHRLLAGFPSRRNLTIVHGDAHVWNYFLPRDGGHDVRLFDWDNWRIGLAAHDLAYMMATHWYPERRRRMERPLLDHYHELLVATGLQGYGREALDEDYRFSLLWHLMTPVWQAAMDLPPVIWWGHLERIMLAVDDLGCRDLLV